jgi:hypothetical protein
VEYMLFIATDTEPDASVTTEAPDGMDEWVAEGARRGIRNQGHRLYPVEDATTVRVRDGNLLVTDGPFAETKEWIAGYDLLECANLDEAIDYASRHPMARRGRLEIRPFWPTEY